MSEESKSTKQVDDTDAVLTDKDAAATMLNPNPHFAKPDPTMGEDEGWNSDATGETLGENQKARVGYDPNAQLTDQTNRQKDQTGQQQTWQASGTNRQTEQSNKESDMMEQAKQTASDVASQVKQATESNGNQAKQTASDTVNQVKQSASESVDQAKQTANEALGQAKQVASETLGQAKQAVSESLSDVKGQMQSTFDAQKNQAAGRLGSVATALRKTSEQLNQQNEPTFASYTQSAADQIENLSTMLQNKDLNGLVNEVQDFARRQPELFIAGSLAAGLLIGRFLKSSGSRSTSHTNYNDYNTRYQGNNNRRSYYGSGNSGRNVAKNSTQDAIARMDYESPAPQNIRVTEGE